MRLMEIDVSSHSTLRAADLAENASYRFERLLSQDAQPQAQAEIEAIVERVLAASPLRRATDPLQARYSLSVEARTLAYVQDDEGRIAPIGPGHRAGASLGGATALGAGYGAGHGQVQIGVGQGGYSGPVRFLQPWVFLTYLYRSEATLMLRDLRSMTVVYETRAKHEGPWPDRANIYASMFDAALRDFPNPSTGPKRVRLEIPR